MLIETIMGLLTGVGGSAVTGALNYFNTKQENEHELKMADVRLKELAAKTDSQIKIKEAEITGAVSLKEIDGFIETQKNSNASSFSEVWIEKLFSVEGKLRYIAVPTALALASTFGFVEFLRQLIRPSVTLYLTGISTWITYKSYTLLNTITNGAIDVAFAQTIFRDSVATLLYLTVTALTWWFGNRMTEKRYRDLLGKK